MPVSPIWPAGSAVNDEGEITFHGRTAASLLDEFGSPLYVIDTDDVRARATKFVHSAATAFNNTVTHVSFAGKALLSKEICRIVTESGMLIDTCTMGEMRIALAAGVPGRRLVLHGNNKSDAEIEYYINTFKPYDKAGAYGIQEWIGYIGIDRIEGSYFTIMGFPVHLVYQKLLYFIG